MPEKKKPKTITCPHCRYERPEKEKRCPLCGYPWPWLKKKTSKGGEDAQNREGNIC